MGCEKVERRRKVFCKPDLSLASSTANANALNTTYIAVFHTNGEGWVP